MNGLWLSKARLVGLGVTAGLRNPGIRAIGVLGAVVAAAYAFRLVTITALCYSRARLLRSPLGGLLILFAWFCSMAGAGFIPLYLRPDYGQNVPLFLPLAALLVCLTAFVVERRRRGEFRDAA